MKQFKEHLLESLNESPEPINEARGRKAAFGNAEGKNFAVNVASLDNNDFLKQPFGRQLGDLRKIGDWKESAKIVHVGAKGKATLASVKAWIKENKPTEFYARWPKDTTNYKDDSVELYYIK